jgi:hypothetical protein
MARPKLNEDEKLVSVTGGVKPTLRQLVESLAADNRWSVATAAGYLIEKGAIATGLLAKADEQVPQLKKAA